MKIDQWLKHAQTQLSAAHIATARLDSLILLEDCLHRDRAWLLAHPETTLDDSQLASLAERLQARATHLPLAYIRGHSEFYGRTFEVNEHVLVPRPESEALINLLLSYADPYAHIADVGTGSGALAITAALELPQSTVSATDIDPACLILAERNAANLQASVTWLHGNLLEPFTSSPDVLLANLPYVPNAHPVNDAARHEPELALYGGSDGLDLYRTMFSQATSSPAPPTFVITESLTSQHQALQSIAEAAGYSLVTQQDLAQAFSR